MLKNYILVTLRNLSREKTYALINILGLSLALACCMILALYIRSELSYDLHNTDHERIARVVVEMDTQGQSVSVATASPALGPLIVRHYPQVGEYVRFNSILTGGADTVLRSNEIKQSWENIYYVDSNVFEIFTHKAVYGDLKNALFDPSSIVVSESLARTYWGDSNPVGKTLETDAAVYRVSAVFEDLPENTHLKYDALLSYDLVLASFGKTNDSLTPGNLLIQMDYVYFKVPEGFQLQELERILNQYYTEDAEDPGKQYGVHITYRVQALADVHFDAAWDYDEPTGNKFYLYGFSAVALFILIVACINYTNLATARATKRSKEVGMRKVIGAGKVQLATQFIGESLVYTLIAFFFSLCLIEILEIFTSLPSLLGKQGLLDLQQQPSLLIWLGLLALGIGIVAGVYPAFYLSSISPLAALTALTAVKRGKTGKFSIRQLLVLVQFFVSIAVVACTLLMTLQMHYISSKPLGFDKDNRMIIQLQGSEVLKQLPVIRDELLDSTNITGVAESSFIPGQNTATKTVKLESNDGQMEERLLWVITVSKEFIDVMGIDVVQGRDFSPERLSDVEDAIIVNEALVRKMNWKNPLNKRIKLSSDQEFRIIGVVNDFHFASLRQSIEPVAIQLYADQVFSNDSVTQDNVVVRPIIIQLSGDDVPQTISYIESVMTRFDPNHPFEYRFLDDSLKQLYLSERNLMLLTGVFSVICIFISSIGLYGLSAFNTELRTKEIGVRKILGASTGSIVLMLAQNQLIPIVISAVLASLVSYLAIDNWLSAFAYRADIQLWVFLLSSAGIALIAFLTIALQSGKTAQANPVDALKYE